MDGNPEQNGKTFRGEESCVAIVLAAGRGARMNSNVPKQYLPLGGKPVLYYALKAFQESFVERVVLVADEVEYCKKEIVERFGFRKVSRVVAGGKERYHSVWAGLQAAGECGYIFIHDGARPFVTEEILGRAYACVREYDACVVGMPVASTPKRDDVWMVQTPQVFSAGLIRSAYGALMESETERKALPQNLRITDDAMVVEYFTNHRVKLVEGSYENIKLTTPEDLMMAECFLNRET